MLHRTPQALNLKGTLNVQEDDSLFNLILEFVRLQAQIEAALQLDWVTFL